MIPPQPPNQGSDMKLEGLSREQIKKIEKSLKKPEFMGLLNEYMVQISDPKNKAEYDQYLKQMQREGELPKHMKLIKLKPEFCFRTQIISNRNKKHEMKFFINMCSSDYIEKPNCEAAKDEKGGVGYNWKIPNSLGKIRYDQDKHKSPCQVIDCAFHPDTFIFAFQNTAFQAMIISIALEGAEKQLGQRKQTLSRDYIILKNLKCKGENGEPALLPIRYIEGKTYNRGQGPTEQERNLQGKQTKLQKQIGKQKQEYEAQKKQEEEEKKKQAQQEKEQDLDDDKNKKILVQDLEKGIQAPKFTSIYTYVTDYSEFIDGPGTKKSRSLPSTFTVEFKVPRMENISEAKTLEINQKKIILGVEEKYYIDLSFEDMKIKNYPLKHAEAKAKFDKKKKTLRVQIPVDISAIPDQDLPVYESPQQVSKESAKQDEVVENQVWKNKVLQIPEQEDTTKFLAKDETDEAQKPSKKLVEEIDEDDYVQEEENKNQQTDEEQIVQKETEDTYQGRKFSVKGYYTPVTPIAYTKQTVPEDLSYIFKQTRTCVVIMFYMRNYQTQDIRLAFNEENGELIFMWLQKKPNASHLLVGQKFIPKAKKIELLKRVGYIALVIHKQNQGQTWGEQCVVNKMKEGPKSIGFYEDQISRVNQELAEIQRKKQEKNRRIEEKKIQEKSKQAEQAGNVQSQERKEKISENRIQTIDDNITKPKINQQAVGQTSLFQKLPFQFIKFDVKFIEALN